MVLGGYFAFLFAMFSVMAYSSGSKLGFLILAFFCLIGLTSLGLGAVAYNAPLVVNNTMTVDVTEVKVGSKTIQLACYADQYGKTIVDNLTESQKTIFSTKKVKVEEFTPWHLGFIHTKRPVRISPNDKP